MLFALIFASLFLGSMAHAQEASFFAAGEGLEKFGITLEHQDFGRAQADSANAGLIAIQEERAALSIPIYNSETKTFAITAKGQRTLITRALRFEDRAVSVPEEFGTAEVGVAFGRRTYGTDKLGLSASFGSAGTRLLGNGRTPILTAGMVLDRKQENGNSWIYFVNYSNNRTFLNNIPIPGIAYAWVKPKSRLVVGLPFTFGFWALDPVYVLVVASPFFATLDTSYRFWGPLQVFTNVGWTPRAYQNLVDGSEDRLIYNKKEWALGLRASMGPRGSLTLGYVREFDRSFVLGEGLGEANSSKIRVEGSGGFQVKARATF